MPPALVDVGRPHRIGWERADPSGDTRHPLLARPKPGRGAAARSRVPIERRTARMQTTTLVISVVALLVALLLGFLVLRSATGGNSKVKVDLGTEVFEAGNAKERANSIAKDGPLLFSDVSGGGQDRPIFVSHIGKDSTAGWYAIDAVPPHAPDGCFLEWDAKTKQFRGVKRCVAETYPADGTGLTRYKATVDKDGGLEIDLRKELGS
jgi:hypothetical protein